MQEPIGVIRFPAIDGKAIIPSFRLVGVEFKNVTPVNGRIAVC